MAERKLCVVQGCGKQSHARGMCNTHYTQERVRTAAPCRIEGCGGRVRTLGLCDAHYSLHRRGGNVNRPKRESKGKSEGIAFLEALVSEPASDDCIPWPFGSHSNGYGAVIFEGRQITASRAVCIMAHGAPQDADLHAAHSCGNGHKGCVNPRHIRWDTPSGNHADRARHGTLLAAERHPRAKLTNEQVFEIRKLCATGQSRASIAKDMGVSRTTVNLIANGKTWKALA